MPKSPKTKHRHRDDSSHSLKKRTREREREREHKSKHKHRSRSRSRNRSNKKDSRKRSRSGRRHSRRSVSKESSSSASSENSIKLLKKLEEKRIREHLERKRQIEEMKAKETPEEKRSRRLREKQAKEARRRERMGWDTEYQHYTNQDNPFGDSHLTSTFVWGKKLEKEGLKNVAPETVEALNRRKLIENKLELEKVKKRRHERELERQEREEEMVLLQRSREAAQFEEWERQEDQFHLEQARLRSTIRIQDGRAKPIDLLAQYISNNNLEESIEMQMHEPYTYLNGLGVHDLEDLLVDIKVYIELEKGNNSEFWGDMTVIVEDELQKLQKRELGGEYHATVGRREGIHQSVAKDVAEIFRGKTAAQLEKLQQRIEDKISGKSDGVDVSYWESLFSQLKAHMARARLRDRHQENLRQKLLMLKSEGDIDGEENGADEHNFLQPTTSTSAAALHKNKETNDQDVIKDDSNEHTGDSAEIASAEHVTDSDDLLETCFKLYTDGCYSPKYLPASAVGDDITVMTADQDERNIERLRTQLIEKTTERNTFSQEELNMHREARKGMAGDEVEFSVETKLDPQVHLWSDKYRPRKPRYFNRVHTGFEWNKYNQTHYDMDNPPPKIVQGYKFNIFYPDLITKSSTPQYFLTPCADNSDFAILRFHAGPPYEDIAFKIVNREWEFSYKRGFRCQFHNNIFQLWFHFKRYRYRR